MLCDLKTARWEIYVNKILYNICQEGLWTVAQVSYSSTQLSQTLIPTNWGPLHESFYALSPMTRAMPPFIYPIHELQ